MSNRATESCPELTVGKSKKEIEELTVEYEHCPRYRELKSKMDALFDNIEGVEFGDDDDLVDSALKNS